MLKPMKPWKVSKTIENDTGVFYFDQIFTMQKKINREPLAEISKLWKIIFSWGFSIRYEVLAIDDEYSTKEIVLNKIFSVVLLRLSLQYL